jgi:hypothetical protein
MAMTDYDATNYPGIRIDDPGGASTFALTCRDALDRIVSMPVGRRMLQEICQYAPTFNPWGGCVKILRANVMTVQIGRPGEEGGSKCAAVNEVNAKNGTGSGSGVHWNPNIWTVPGQGMRPPYIGLAHELVHAWHNARGTKKGDYDEEEQFTVGLGQYAIADANMITENRIRLEHNVGLRHQY